MTAQELKDLAALLQLLAKALVEFRTAHPLTNDEERRDFNTALGNIQKTAEAMMNQALDHATSDIGTSVAALQDETKKAAAAVKNAKTLADALAIAGAAFSLGAALLHPTPSTVVGALDNLGQAIQKAAATPAAGSK
jgi:hypothetical protein